jgi:hypothetical protein
VERFVSAYLLRTNGQAGDQRRVETRERMKAGKDAAGRF